MTVKKRSYDYKIYVAGYFQAGKTTLIHSLDKNAMSIDKPLKKLYQGEPGSTTVGFDLGYVLWLRPNEDTKGVVTSREDYKEHPEEYENWLAKLIELKGGPGQLHFKPVREHVCKDSDGVIFVIDSSDINAIGHAISLLAEARNFLGEDIPIKVVANKQDLEEANEPEAIADLIGEPAYGVSAKENFGVTEAILDLLLEIEGNKVPSKTVIQ